MEMNKCFCEDPERVAELNFDVYKGPYSGIYYYTELNFGKVIIGSEVTKSVYISNDSGQAQVYHLQKTSTTTGFHPVFDCKVVTKQKVIKPDQVLQSNVTFRPAFPNEKCFDKFEIIDGSQNKHIILAGGESIGPNVKASVKKLHFFITRDYVCTKKTFEITNTSVETIFQFDFDSDVFAIDKPNGTVPERKSCYITVVFNPKKVGIYFERLWCLLLNQEPVLVELVGIYQPKITYNMKQLVLKQYSVPLQYRIGNFGYFENTSLEKFVPPVALKPNYLHFNNVKSLSFIMKNNSNDEMKIIWLQDESNIFSITPDEIVIPPKMYVKFECSFAPPAENEVYMKTLLGQVHWYEQLRKNSNPLVIPDVDKSIVYIPYAQYLKCSGHSFQQVSPWITAARVVPNYVTLPPCVGSSNSWTSFLLKSTCRLPLLFNVIPPNESNVLMKPMTGVIEGGMSQIMTVQFNPPSTDTLSLIEKWQISLCDQSDVIPVQVVARCDIPSMIVGRNNVIEFSWIQVGWRQALNVPLRNTSSFPIKYTLTCEDNEYLEIEQAEGYIQTNQEIFIKMYFTGNICAPTKTYIKCKCEAIQGNLLIGTPSETSIKVLAYSAYSQLCAFPKEIDFGDVEWSTKMKTVFHIFNFGTAPINFKLFPRGVTTEKITLKPNEGIIKCQEKLGISLKVRATERGSKLIEILYKLSAGIENPISIYTLKYSCFYPTFRVTEIIEHNFNSLFSKARLWELLNIPMFNEILQTISHREKRTLICHLPDYEHGKILNSIKFLLANDTKFNVSISLKRVRMCTCEPVDVKSLTFRKKTYNCPHRDMLSMDVSRKEIFSNTKEILTLEVKYSEIGNNTLCYLMELSHNRTIEIILKVNSISNEICTLSVYNPQHVMNLQEVFIGLKNPPLQCFWLYNNTSNAVTYHVDDTELVKLCNEEDFNVLDCLNPVDEVKPYSYCPIVFQFHPMEVKKYDVSIPLLLGDKVVELKITGLGTMEYKRSNLTFTPMPLYSRTLIDYTVDLSSDEITVEGVQLWSVTDRMIFMRNNTKDRTFSYSWEDCYLEGLIYIESKVKTGFIDPKETKPIVIKIYSMGEPCVFNLIMSCRLLDQTQLELHKKSQEEYEKNLQVQNEYFTITENEEIIYDTKPIKPPLPAPKEFFLTLGINIEILDTMDSILYGDVDAILRSTPRNTIEINKDIIMQRYIERMTQTYPPIEYNSSISTVNNTRTRESTRPFRKESESIDRKVATTTPLANIDDCEVKVISETIGKLIGQVVFSDLFKRVVETDLDDTSTYYCQYKLNQGDEINHSPEPSRRSKFSSCRYEETKKFLNYPEPEVLANTLEQLIYEAVDILFFRTNRE